MVLIYIRDKACQNPVILKFGPSWMRFLYPTLMSPAPDLNYFRNKVKIETCFQAFSGPELG